MSEEKKGIADAENSTTTETMADYAKELEASFRTIREGDVISGTVIDVRETGVTLDLGYYAPAVIKTEDLSKDPSFSVLADIHVGDTLEGTVVKRDDGAGNIQMSCVEAAETLGWDRLKQYQEEKTILKIKVSESVNQGVTAYVEGIRGFIPASQLALDYVEDTTEFVGKTLEVRVITVDSDRQKLVLSAKDVLKEKEAERLNHKISMIVPGRGTRGKPDAIRCICGSWRWIKWFGTHFPDQPEASEKAFRGADSRRYRAGSCFKYEGQPDQPEHQGSSRERRAGRAGRKTGGRVQLE